MNEKNCYKRYKLKNGLRWRIQGTIDKHFYQPKGKQYKMNIRKMAGRKVLSMKESNALISELIRSGKPFWLARYGNTEMQFLNSVLYRRYVNGKTGPLSWDVESRVNLLCQTAGFFPADRELAVRYADECFAAAKNIDIHAMWDIWMEEYMIGRLEPNAKVIKWGYIAPYYQRKTEDDRPWTAALKGKKVLVINHFAESIEKQYKNNRERLFEKIFDADDILPEFELITFKSVQTAGGNRDDRFKDWFEALNWMIEEIKKIDFDVALIGCGAYGFLIADAIKKMGKGAIQTCGCTQMIFGVLGQRWTGDKKLMEEVINDAWVRPSDGERFEGINNVEGACYW